MKKQRPFLLILLLSLYSVVGTTSLSAQLITRGAANSLYQQMDNSSLITADWTRSVGIGYFNPNGAVPESFLHVNTEFSLLPQNGSIAGLSETFRTTVAAGQNQQWRMERGQLEIGRLYHTNPNNSFRIQVVQPATALQAAAHLFMELANGDGIKIHANTVTAVPETVNGYLLNRRGYVAMGASTTGWNGLSPAAPWSRLHLTHDQQGAVCFGFRPQMRNGVTLTGNSALSYFGQWYDQGVSGTDPEIDDHSNTVIASSANVLPAGLAHHYGTISHRFFGALGMGGAAGAVQGMEFMQLRPFRLTATDPIQPFVGIGDFLGAGTGPEERLDVLNGRLRVRGLPNQPSLQLDKVLVVDNEGVVHWRPANTLPGQELEALRMLVNELTARLAALEAKVNG